MHEREALDPPLAAASGKAKHSTVYRSFVYMALVAECIGADRPLWRHDLSVRRVSSRE
jgi:hypothetical protein